jgi:hypothetical protein
MDSMEKEIYFEHHGRHVGRYIGLLDSTILSRGLNRSSSGPLSTEVVSASLAVDHRFSNSIAGSNPPPLLPVWLSGFRGN